MPRDSFPGNQRYPTPRGWNNDVAAQSRKTVDKDDAADKKRKAIEAAPPTSMVQRPKFNEDAPCGQASRSPDLNATRGQASLTDPSPSTARDQIENWLDDETAVEQGFIRTGRKTYRPPLPNLYTEPEVDDTRRWSILPTGVLA